MAEDKNNTHYFLDITPGKTEQLQFSQEEILYYMGNPIWAPLDLSAPDRMARNIRSGAPTDCVVNCRPRGGQGSHHQHD
ncbi:hypothetical protein PG985_014234 [Apiospora marii]|uniref:uncharacterized protein n=1 Tax=Apiospora marii TaxID=335849 RepID=UPI0031324024